ncbi:MAG: replication-associated recombination protein A [Myxococcales bacterium]|nr:MAG: replication-associated recombination protein A [Myxococcales bacterium]
MDLFDRQEKEGEGAQPLAARLRPHVLEEFVGQEHIIGEGKFLRTMISRDQIPSLILWGPPGSGKTTLAEVIANSTKSDFVFYSAVLGSVKEIREIIDKAKERRKFFGKRTILFVDEIHRFNKAQQDAFLPWVERGVVTLIGATTENPSFEVNAALLSRCKVLVLNALTPEQIGVILDRALRDEQRGLGGRGLALDAEARRFLAEGAYGDARRALTTLESAVELVQEQGATTITLALVEEAQQKKALLYDKAGEEHYNVISAFIKSLRGSDPDAAVYWMARMLEAGEDPLFILRRMVIFASEDIGSADPTALQVAIAATDSFRFIGLPEGVLPMSQAATYLACAPKSNAALSAYQRALGDVKQHGPLPVPLHIRNAPTRLMKDLGYGRQYKYPHNFDGHYTPEVYLPDELVNRRYYEPAGQGEEKRIKERLDAWRAQARAGVEKREKKVQKTEKDK